MSDDCISYMFIVHTWRNLAAVRLLSFEYPNQTLTGILISCLLSPPHPLVLTTSVVNSVVTFPETDDLYITVFPLLNVMSES